ncbi:MAG TPA: hypothetical protein VKV27_01555 [Solirubrobacteraceae bacterium]|nr:hypothetical protein [Solirubrobacteraceae bacterium]
MYTYRVISEGAGVPEMNDLHAVLVDEPGRIEGGFIVFAERFGMSPAHENAVGKRCRVIRTGEDGQPAGETGGAVRMVEPLQVSLDGGGWQ